MSANSSLKDRVNQIYEQALRDARGKPLPAEPPAQLYEVFAAEACDRFRGMATFAANNRIAPSGKVSFASALRESLRDDDLIPGIWAEWLKLAPPPWTYALNRPRLFATVKHRLEELCRVLADEPLEICIQSKKAFRFRPPVDMILTKEQRQHFGLDEDGAFQIGPGDSKVTPWWIRQEQMFEWACADGDLVVVQPHPAGNPETAVPEREQDHTTCGKTRSAWLDQKYLKFSGFSDSNLCTANGPAYNTITKFRSGKTTSHTPRIRRDLARVFKCKLDDVPK